MIKRFDIARFIEHKGNKIVIGLGMAVILAAGLVFYLYGLGAINDFEKAGWESVVVNPETVKETLKDVAARTAERERLQKTPLRVIDIFR